MLITVIAFMIAADAFVTRLCKKIKGKENCKSCKILSGHEQLPFPYM